MTTATAKKASIRQLSTAQLKGARALAVFCSGQDDLFEVIKLPRPVPGRVVIGHSPDHLDGADSFVYTTAIRYFGRALGRAQTGDTSGAEADLARLREIEAALQAAKDEYWSTEVDVQGTEIHKIGMCSFQSI